MKNISFNDLGLHSKILQAIDNMGFEEPSQIQAESIPVILEGKDVIGQAQTGTGKTLAFGAPMLSKIEPRCKNISSIIVTPTRELAIQVNDELSRIAKFRKIALLPIYGGQPIERQIKSLRRGVDVVVGTPGRILDHLHRRTLDLSGIEFLIIDEADEMLDMGFIEDIENIIKSCNSDRQTLLFSATMPSQIKRLASKYMKNDAAYIEIAKNTLTVEKTKQYYYEIKNKDRFESLCRILDVDEPSSAIIFCRTKRGVDELVEGLQSRGYNVEGMHGDMGQNQRLNTLRKFKDASLDFLVATDVAARGIDVENVSHVINYDLPQDTESYVHRIGRTGRANKEGIAYSLVTPKEYILLKQIEKFTKSKIKRKEIPTVDDIFEAKYKNIEKKIKDVLSEDNYKNFVPVATELDEEYNLVDVAAALMKIIFDKELSFNYKENSINVEEENMRLFFSIGRMDSITPRKLLKFITETSSIEAYEIGDIDILNKFTFISVPERVGNVILKKSNGKRLQGRRVSVELAKSKKSHH
ncbi:DEAD/DEAH box helicase [Clostridium luticellarii]|jgi:ATP-dependent RNA helicase DeaD|uniref:ATP-dependent RNA helicase CshA n=1 Tax=Clostridium luticellarii TaxID=1691940 RepID=A0A2T0BQ74_9CLOT|nr:DEAD/DEAH box helicase [Clostridium luticellarii]MCI1944473.1 DEAD/DEAH box helicase [Clostridium luticellarii]MCI1967972.1 DEAD/DEAH box helicase [Clostridium luticellarii]MCI1995089.1 DEAD/DEAH box helicase [Clostridium luticellarii]MCI2039248.1 DEAD/DEAH box helicase [Clostridium luticellarii]PRR86028.1 DEAD-box ATP-dependent RNA helicase CshA [Clostridium luticellarii]